MLCYKGYFYCHSAVSPPPEQLKQMGIIGQIGKVCLGETAALCIHTGDQTRIQFFTQIIDIDNHDLIASDLRKDFFTVQIGHG